MLRTVLAVFAAVASWSSVAGASVIPRDTNIEVRLLTPLGSRSSKVGDKIEAVVIAPVSVENTVLPLQGSTLNGRVTAVHAIGLGLKHAAADITVHFDSIRIPGGGEFPMSGSVSQIETARERVDQRGQVLGIDPAANVSAAFSFALTTVLVHTEMEAPTYIIKLLTARTPDSEITLPAGTDLFVRFEAEANVPEAALQDVTPPEISVEDLTRVRETLNRLPSQRCQFVSRRDSDLVNVALIGTDTEIRNAFSAAGWNGESRHSLVSFYKMFYFLMQRNGFGMAPMSTLTLNGAPATLTFQKSLDTVVRRHHIRLWRQPDSDIWLGAATEDVAVTLRRARITHVSSPKIDNERAKVANDLAFTGCVQGASVLPREDFTSDPRSTRMVATDGNVGVLRMGTCTEPVETAPTHVLSAREHFMKVVSGISMDTIRANPLTAALTTARAFRRLLRPEMLYNNNHPIERVSVIGSYSERASLH
jgi:hypothetical protein